MPVDRSRLPEQGKNPPFHFPAVERTTLASGLRVWSVRHVAIPVATVMLLVRRGASEDPAGKEGLAALTADMMDEGTGDLSAIAMHESLARIGAQLDSDIGPDATLFTLTVLSRFLRPGLSLLSDIVVRPTLREEDFARVRQLRAVATVQAVFRAWAAATKQARYDALAVCACRQRACSACLRAWGVTCMHVVGSRRGSDYAMRDRPQWPPRTAGCDRRAARLARCRTRCTSAPARGGGGDGCRRGLDRIGCGEARRREPDT